MDETGLGNDAEYLRLFSKIGEMMGEESYPQYKKYFEHLEYLGAKTTEHKDSDGYSSFQVDHPILNFWIYPSSHGLYHRILIYTKKSLKKQEDVNNLTSKERVEYDRLLASMEDGNKSDAKKFSLRPLIAFL